MLRKMLSNRFPDFQSVVLVFSVICMFLYGWTIVNIAWKLNSWLSTLNPWEIFSLISYLMVFNFLESTVILAGLLGACFILPGSVLKERFVDRGIITVVCILVSMASHLMINSSDDSLRINFLRSLRLWWLFTFLLTTVLTWFLPKIPVLVKWLQEFADRATVFLFLLMPLSMAGFIVIVLRFFFAG